MQSPPEKVDNKSNKAEVIKFLGYDWSNRKGDEGIKYLTNQVQETDSLEDDDDKDTEIVQAINSIKFVETPLYNPNNDNDETKFSYALRKHIIDCCNKFSSGVTTVGYKKPYSGESDGLLRYARLTDMIDFGRATFNLVIKTNIEKKAEEVRYKEGIYFLGMDSIANIEYGTRIVKKKSEGTIYPVYGGGGETFRTDEYNRENRFVISRFGMSPECVRYVSGKFYLNDSGLTVKSKDDRLDDSFLNLFLYCNQPAIFALGRGIAQKNLDMKAFASFKVPLPSQIIQQEIVAQCHKIDDESYLAKQRIAKLQDEISGIIANVRGEKKRLGGIARFKNGLNYKEAHVGDTVNIVGVADFKNNKSPEWDKVKTITISEHVDDSYLLHKYDLVTVRSNGSRELVGRFMLIDKEPEKRTTFSGFSIRVRIISDEVNSEFLYYLLSSANVRQRLTTGSNGANIKSLNQDLLSNLEIPLPSLSEQKLILDTIKAIEDEIASLKIICDGAAARKKAVFRRELIDDVKQGNDITETKIIDLHRSTEDYQSKEFETLVAAEPFECYKWNRFDQTIIDFFGGDKTILIGCTKDKRQREWVLEYNIYNVRLGKTKGSVEEHREMFDRTSLLVLYEKDKPERLTAFKVVRHKQMGKDELKAMGYPSKFIRKSYETFNIIPLEMDLSPLVNQHLIEKLIEINPENKKGTPVFIEP